MQDQRRSFIASFGRRLRSQATSTVFLLAVAVPGLLLAVKVVGIAVAATMGQSSDPTELQKAVRLDPSNPNLHYRLGLAYCYSLDHSHPEEGLSELRQATELVPTEPTYWSALASACESVGERPCADKAMERTLALAPMTPRHRWDAANHDLVAGRPNEALAEFRRLLELDPGYAPEAFRLCLRVDADPGDVYQKVLADQRYPQLNFAYINYLSSHGEGKRAYPVWQATLSLNQHFPFSLADPYLEWLLRQGHTQLAIVAWQALEQHEIIRKSSADTPNNALYNSGFEEPLLNAGFGWRVQEDSYTRVSQDSTRAYQGRRSLRVNFTVPHNEDYEPVYEIVPVTPNNTYILQGYVRSDSITSNSGPRLRVVDSACPTCLDVPTQGTVGTTGWHRLTVSFSTGPRTRLVQVSVWRPRSPTFPSRISGTFWLDAVSLNQTTRANNQVAQGDQSQP